MSVKASFLLPQNRVMQTLGHVEHIKERDKIMSSNQTPDEEKSSYLNNQGYDLAEEGRWAEAILYYQKALQLNSRNIHSLTNLGNALLELGRLDEALVFQEKALEVEPNSALAWANKAVTLARLNRRPEAILCYDRSLQIEPSNKITWFNKGSSLFFMGHNAEAIKCFDHILENMDPEMINALGAKSEVLQKLGQVEESAKCLNRIKEIESNRNLSSGEKSKYEHFSFESTQITFNAFGEQLDGRKILRGFEAALRLSTGIHQISADFNSSGNIFESVNIEYTPDRGYYILLQPMGFMLSGRREAETYIVDFIKKHSKENDVHPLPPPIPRTSVSIEESMMFDSRLNRYEALAHDGGYLVTFYIKKATGLGVVSRHISPIGMVHYQFQYLLDYKTLLKDAAEHCSAFLDLSFLGSHDLSEETISVFLEEHQLYGRGKQS